MDPIDVNFLTYKLGDANGSGGTDTGDAVAVLKKVGSKNPNPFKEVPADANKDNKVDTGDAVKILKYVGGKDTLAPELEIPETSEYDEIVEPD